MIGNRTRRLIAGLAAGVLLAGCAAERVPQAPRRTLSDESPFADVEPVPPDRPRPQTPSLDAPLSVGECIRFALDNNPRVGSSWHRVRAAAALVGQAEASYYPQLEFNARSERTETPVLTEVESKFIRSVHSANFTVTQLLLDGGARRARLASAKAGLVSEDLIHDSTLLDVALDAEAACYELLAAQARQEVEQENVRARTRQLELAERRLETGLGRSIEVSQARAERADAVLNEVVARAGVRAGRGQLASVMGLLPSTPLVVRDLPEADRARQIEAAEALIEEAALNRPRLRSAVAEMRRLEAQLKAEKAGRWPTLNLSGLYGWRDTHILPEERKEWSIALNLNWPLFTGFDRTYRIRQAEAQLRQLRGEYDSLLQSVELEVWNAYSELLRADEAIVAAEQFLDSARESVESVEQAYAAGKATILELTDAQTVFVRAANRKVTARLGRHLAVARLERAVGRAWNSGLDAPEGAAPEETSLPITPARAADDEAGGR
mgnify:CR=1 FL=1